VDGYGTGVVMGVPAHDTRDYEFANQFNLEITRVIESENKISDLPFLDQGTLINSDMFNGINSQEAFDKISEYFVKNKLGEEVTSFRLRDWGISRQRYWGCPIPVYYLDDGTVYPVPEEDLPYQAP
jgi:leucyl-tRNA synthetase